MALLGDLIAIMHVLTCMICAMNRPPANCVLLQVQNLSYLVQAMGNDAFSKRYRKLSQGLCEVSSVPAFMMVQQQKPGLQFSWHKC